MAMTPEQEVARLLNRVAFGATPADLDTWAERPYEDLVEHLLDVPSDVTQRQLNPAEFRQAVDESTTLFTSAAAAHWMQVMRTTAYPLEERVVFFWHDHFATSGAGGAPRYADVVAQINTIRRHAFGSFRELVAAITVDPAMLMWLDGDVSTKDKPNENYARELFELFTLGTVPQRYTEEDVREAARVLTGWEVTTSLTLKRAARFNPAKHDTGTKQVLGRTITAAGDREYRELIDVALDQEVAPLFVAYKLVKAFAYTPDTVDLVAAPDPLVDEVAASLRATDWDLREAYRTLLLSPYFRRPDATRGQQLVRPPVDLVVHAAKLFDLDFDDFITSADRYLADMGQIPLAPPSVFGWPDSEHWLTTTGTIARYLLGWAVITSLGRVTNRFALAGHGDLPPSGNLAAWTRRLGLPGLSRNTELAVRDHLLALAGEYEPSIQESVLLLLLASPEWEVV